MYKEVNDIVYEIMNTAKKKNNEITKDLFEKISNFYKNNDYLIFINYSAEINFEGDDIKEKINSSFLQNKENYKYRKYNIEIEDLTKNKDNLEKYLSIKKKYIEKIKLLFPKIFIVDNAIDTIDTILISSFLGTKIDDDTDLCKVYEIYQSIKNNVNNLNNDKIEKEIEDILKNDEIYKIFFSILNSKYVSEFFKERIIIKEDKDEFQFSSLEEKDSECFTIIFDKFLEDYDRQNEHYKDFKKLIIFKTLSTGDRAYVIKKFKNYIINPNQFSFGKNLINEDFKKISIILKGYLIIIFLHETEHFLRLYNENQDVFNNTPRKKEGGELFMKYIFGIKVISNIDYNQAEKILEIENWKDKDTIKAIFKDQSDVFVSDEYCPEKYPDSISYYSTKIKSNINLYMNDNDIPLKK